MLLVSIVLMRGKDGRHIGPAATGNTSNISSFQTFGTEDTETMRHAAKIVLVQGTLTEQVQWTGGRLMHRYRRQVNT